MVNKDPFGDLVMRADWQDEMLKKIDSRLDKLDKNMRELSTRASIMQEKVKEHHKTLYGNGRPGILETFNKWKGGMALFMFITVIAQILVGMYF